MSSDNDSNLRQSGPGLFTSLGGQYGGGAGAGMGQLSPYLNIDPSYLRLLIISNK